MHIVLHFSVKQGNGERPNIQLFMGIIKDIVDLEIKILKKKPQKKLDFIK